MRLLAGAESSKPRPHDVPKAAVASKTPPQPPPRSDDGSKRPWRRRLRHSHPGVGSAARTGHILSLSAASAARSRDVRRETVPARWAGNPGDPHERQPVETILAWVGVLTSSGLGLIALLNLIVNPYAQYPTRCLPPLVQTSRTEKLALFSRCSPTPEGLILGSSRVLQLEPGYVSTKTGLNFFNAGMNYAKPEDYLAFVRYFERSAGCLPRMVILGVDVHAFSDALPVDPHLLCEPAPGVPRSGGYL